MNDTLSKVLSNAEEVVTPSEIEEILSQKPKFNFYYGTAPTGPFHFAYLIPLNKVIQLTQAGGKGVILLADYHAHLDDRKTPFEVMELRSQYYDACTRAVLGEHAKKLKFVRGSSYQHRRDYVEDVYKLSARITTTRATRAASEVVRMRDEPKISSLLYPILQILDVEYLHADITVGGTDQRKIYMLGREVLPELGYAKGAYIFTPLLPSLKGGGAKMSSSDPLSHIRVTDSVEDINSKIEKAYCPPGVLDQNPITSTVRYILLPRYARFLISRKEKFGGDIVFESADEFEKAYVDQKIHPQDLKAAVAEKLAELLAPARAFFDTNSDILANVEASWAAQKS